MGPCTLNTINPKPSRTSKSSLLRPPYSHHGWSVGNGGEGSLQKHTGGFPKSRGYLCGVLIIRLIICWGFILGRPYPGKLPHKSIVLSMFCHHLFPTNNQAQSASFLPQVQFERDAIIAARESLLVEITSLREAMGPRVVDLGFSVQGENLRFNFKGCLRRMEGFDLKVNRNS